MIDKRCAVAWRSKTYGGQVLNNEFFIFELFTIGCDMFVIAGSTNEASGDHAVVSGGMFVLEIVNFACPCIVLGASTLKDLRVWERKY